MSAATMSETQDVASKTPSNLDRNPAPKSTTKVAQRTQREEPSTPTATKSTPKKAASSAKQPGTSLNSPSAQAQSRARVKGAMTPAYKQSSHKKAPDASKDVFPSKQQTPKAVSKAQTSPQDKIKVNKGTLAATRNIGSPAHASRTKTGSSKASVGPLKNSQMLRRKQTIDSDNVKQSPGQLNNRAGGENSGAKSVDHDAGSDGEGVSRRDDLQHAEPVPVDSDYEGAIKSTSAMGAHAQAGAEDVKKANTGTDSTVTPTKQQSQKRSSNGDLLEGARGLVGRASEMAGRAFKKSKSNGVDNAPIDSRTGLDDKAADNRAEAHTKTAANDDNVVTVAEHKRADSAHDSIAQQEDEHVSNAEDYGHEDIELQDNDRESTQQEPDTAKLQVNQKLDDHNNEQEEDVNADISHDDLPLVYSVLKGLEVDPEGNVYDNDGEAIGRLAEGDAEDLGGYPIGDDAEILDEDGDLVGRIELLPTEIIRQLKQMEETGEELPPAAARYLSLASAKEHSDDEEELELPDVDILEGLTCGLDGIIYDDDGNTVGVVTEGKPEVLQSARLNNKGEFLNDDGKVVGHAEVHEEAAQLVEEGMYDAIGAQEIADGEAESRHAGPQSGGATQRLRVKKAEEAPVDSGNALTQSEDEELEEELGPVEKDSAELPTNGSDPVDDDENVQNNTVTAERATEKLAGVAATYDIRILEGRKVNRKAKVLDDDGEQIGQLIDGDAAACTGKLINAKGNVLAKDGKVLGAVKVSEGEAAQEATRVFLEDLEQDRKDDLPGLEILEGLKVNKKGKILNEDGEPVGELVDGIVAECAGKKCNDQGEVLDRKGSVIGHVTTLPTSVDEEEQPAVVHEEIKDDEEEEETNELETPEGEADSDSPPLTILEGYTVNKAGRIIDDSGNIIGELVEGDPKKLSKLKATCDTEGKFWDNRGRVIGQAKTLPFEDYEEEAPFAGLEGLKVSERGWVVDDQGNRVGQVVEGDAKKLIGRSVDEDGDIIDKRGSVVGHAERYSEEEAPPMEDDPDDISFLQGKTVNKAGLVMNDGIPMARVVQGRVKEMAGRKLDADGQVWNDSGKVIGRVELIPEDERDEKPEGPFAGLGGLKVIKDGKVADENDNVVGVIVEGNAKRLVGLTVDEDGDIVDRFGNVKGHAEPWEEPEEEEQPAEDLSALNKTTINKAGNAVDSSGAIIGHVVEGDIKRLVGKKVDAQGQIWDNSGNVVGRCELVVGEDNSPDGPFAGFEGLKVQKDGTVTSTAGDTVGRIADGDIKKLVGHSVDEDGDILDKNGNRLGKAERWEPEEKERRKNPMSGLRINREGEVRDQNGELVGKLTEGKLGHCVGQEIDDNGNVVDQDGDKIGEATLLENIDEETYEAPSQGELDEARKREEEREIASKMANICQQTLERVQPICRQISDHMEVADRTPKDELDEEALVEKVKPLIEEGGRILQECNGSLRGLDPDGHIAAQAKGRAGTNEAAPEEYRLAETLKELTSTVVTTIDAAKKKLNSMPHAKKKLNPLWALLTQPLFQILAAVGLLLAGVLGLVGQLLNGLGLGGLVNGLLGGLGIGKLLGSIGLGGGRRQKRGNLVGDLPIIGGLLGGKA